MVSTSKHKNELEDFEAFLEPKFEPIQFANDLLLITNDKEGTELDGVTPLKKLKFDIDECNKRMTTISANNYESLVSNFSQIEQTKELIDQKINPLVERLNNSFERIRSSVIQPYEKALQESSALKRIHLTLNLLRGASYFMFLVQQLEEVERINDKVENESNTKKDLIRLARLHVQISQFYKDEKDVNSLTVKNSSSSVLSLKLIRDFEAIQMNKKNTLINEWTQSIINDINHNTTFSSNNIDLQNKLFALSILNEKEYIQTIEKCINKHVQINLSQLSRSLQSPRNFSSILHEVKDSSSEFLNKLEDVLSSCEPSSSSNSKDKSVNLLEKILSGGSQNTLSDLYWPALSYKFKKNIVATMARGGPIAKNLKVYYVGIKHSTKEILKDSTESDLLIEAVEVIEGSK